MASNPLRLRCLTGNQLKILAMLAMTADHVGLQLFPQVGLLRILGRLAFPIYGWMIAEGCRHTRNRRRYFLRLAGLALVCQVVYFFAMGSLYQCVLVTFSLSALVIFAGDRAKKEGSLRARTVLVLLVGALVWLTAVLPGSTSTDFAVDYGLWGVMLPVFVYFGENHRKRLALLALTLVLLALDFGGIQWFGLAAVGLLALYSGQRGSRNLGTLFYLYYPLHLMVIFAISLIVSRQPHL